MREDDSAQQKGGCDLIDFVAIGGSSGRFLGNVLFLPTPRLHQLGLQLDVLSAWAATRCHGAEQRPQSECSRGPEP